MAITVGMIHDDTQTHVDLRMIPTRTGKTPGPNPWMLPLWIHVFQNPIWLVVWNMAFIVPFHVYIYIYMGMS